MPRSILTSWSWIPTAIFTADILTCHRSKSTRDTNTLTKAPCHLTVPLIHATQIRTGDALMQPLIVLLTTPELLLLWPDKMSAMNIWRVKLRAHIKEEGWRVSSVLEELDQHQSQKMRRTCAAYKGRSTINLSVNPNAHVTSARCQ